MQALPAIQVIPAVLRCLALGGSTALGGWRRLPGWPGLGRGYWATLLGGMAPLFLPLALLTGSGARSAGVQP